MAKFYKSNKYACITAGITLLVMIISLFCLRLGVADNGLLTQRLVSMGMYDAEGASGTGYYSTGFGVADKSFSIAPDRLVYSLFKVMFPVDSVLPAALPAIIYMAMAVWGIFMIAKALTCDMKWNNMLMCFLLVLIGAETGYVTFFNTPYECGAAIAYFIPMIGALLMGIRYEKLPYTVIFAIFGMLFAGTMPQSGLIGIFIAAFSVYLAFKQSTIVKKTALGIAGILILVCGVYGLSNMTDTDKYNSVFYGVASVENAAYSTVLSDLKIIGQDELSGKASFEQSAQNFIASPEYDGVMAKVNPVSVIRMYAKNPEYARRVAKTAGNNSMFIKAEYLGNYSAASGKAGQVSGFFSLYSRIKKSLVPGNIITLAVIFALIVFFAADYKKKYAFSGAAKSTCVLCIFLTAAAFLSLFVPIAYFGMAQISFNLIIYNLVFDTLVIFAAVGGTKLLMVRRNILREKFGVNQ